LDIADQVPQSAVTGRISADRRPAWLVVVGASGGAGLGQVLEFLEAMPAALDGAIVVVLHRSPDQPSMLPVILARHSRLPVIVPEDGERLRTGRCYLGLPDRHLAVGPDLIATFTQDHAYRGSNIDLLFSSAARHAGGRAVGVILSGMLRDGAAGLADIKTAGGVAMVLDSIWSHTEGMPRAALRAVPRPDAVGTVSELAAAVLRQVGETPQPAPGA
jgi:chemotaxis response regulator CheB